MDSKPINQRSSNFRSFQDARGRPFFSLVSRQSGNGRQEPPGSGHEVGDCHQVFSMNAFSDSASANFLRPIDAGDNTPKVVRSSGHLSHGLINSASVGQNNSTNLLPSQIENQTSLFVDPNNLVFSFNSIEPGGSSKE